MLMKFKRIYNLRVDNDLMVKDIAKIIGITEDNYYDYEHARSNFPLDKLNTFVNYFNVSFDYITELSDTKTFYDNNVDYNLLKERLKTIRKEKHYSQTKIASILGDKQSTYWNYEKGSSTIPISKLYLLAKEYNISIDYFLGKTDDKSIK